MFYRNVAAGVLALSLIFTSGLASAESLLDEVKARGTVKIGLRKDFPPVGFIDRDGSWVGTEIDFAHYVAEKLGVELEMVEVISKTKIPLLLNGNIDILMAASNPTRERAKIVDFTQPYQIDGQTILVRKDSGITTLDDLANHKVGTVQGSLDGDQLVKRQPTAELVYFQEYPNAVLALQSGRVDAVTTSYSVLAKFAAQDDNLVVMPKTFRPDPFVMIIRQDDSKWRLALEDIIMSAMDDGTLKKIHEKYIGGALTVEPDMWADYYKK
ncbi:transporter substrate-binding domain-containing protein [Acuticoccus mangrovi]|uniref:Transporter substrate-binding domain-containing protein n=1 Tax=Acuticoccus mangrovi TaxID=2796142 RepID=A0A934IRV1_9HYPH|nr:transporter substrate-binding domain-containing protein [Acuticoccus mangrovi]MBJ3777097.1 transporter substrate-binding domain-containing protein [Acuticoccus mangrovi]